MGLRINTNMQSLNAHKNLTKTDGQLSRSLERLSSGLRINKAADDSSGLAIADGLRAQHTGISQAINNANDAVNIVQIADGALEESINIVNTIRTKAIQAASDGQNKDSRAAIQADVNKLLEELQMIGETTAFNGINLLDGSFQQKTFHIGAYKDESIQVNFGDARASKIGAAAYAKTQRQSESAVSSPFMRGSSVTNDALSAGNLRINNVAIGSSITQFDAGASVGSLKGFGSAGTAFAKAIAINAKTNETGVQAKATTELVVSVATTLSGTNINGMFGSMSAVNTGAKMVSFINNNVSAKENGVRAELVTGNLVRIIAEDGRNLRLTGGTAAIGVNGANMSGLTFTQRGSLTLSNARAMVNGEGYIKSATINTGDLVINGIDIAAGGALKVKQGDDDRTLVNAINNNKELQALGVRAELYRADGDGATEKRLRIISEKDPLTITGNNTKGVANVLEGTREGIKTTGIMIEGAAVDTDATSDNYLRRIGFNGTRYGTTESSGAANAGGNDIAVVSRAYLTTGAVTNDVLSAGNLLINGVQIGSSITQFDAGASVGSLKGFGSAGTAFAKAIAINAKTNQTGVQAKATTELVVSVATTLSGTNINGMFGSMSAVDTGAKMVSFINNNVSAKENGVRAELVTGNIVRIIADDGRNLRLTGGTAAIGVNGANMSGLNFTQRGTLTLSNARAMTNGDGYVKSATINAGELIINGIDVAKGGSLTVKQGDDDRTLVNAINNNEDLQKLGIRAELYRADGDGATEKRIRLISQSNDITISGTDPSKVANLKSGTTSGVASSVVNIQGALVDTDQNADNYIRRIGLSGSQYGTTEETGVSNTSNNDRIVFGKDRLNYESGDVEINGYKIGQASDDGISHAKGDMSALALANAINLVKDQTGVEADIIKAVQTGAGMVKAGTLQQRDLVINGVDIVRDNTGGNGMAIKNGDADHTLMEAINEYTDQTGVTASIDDGGKLVLSAVDGRNIHVQSTATGNKFVKFEADFGEGKGVAQDSVYMGNIRLVSDKDFEVKGNGSSNASKEISLLKLGLAGGGASTEATSDLKGDGVLKAGKNYKSAMANVDVTTQEGAEMAIRTADFAIKTLDAIRSGLGSTQNQLTSTIANLSVTRINVQGTESTIRDVDFADESSNFSKMQVLMQAGTYAMSQANASSQNVMRLLQ